MRAPIAHVVRDQHLWLTSARVLFWEEQSILVVSDLHFGKTGHFRKEGIPIPADIYREDLQRLVHQIQFFQPQQVIFVGDLFHSRMNRELDWFLRWRNDLSNVNMQLIVGNHDILSNTVYANMGLTLHRKGLSIGPFRFVHAYMEEQSGGSPKESNSMLSGLSDESVASQHNDSSLGDEIDLHQQTQNKVDAGNSGLQPSGYNPYPITGHIHPGIRIKGAGKQSFRFPCFYFGATHAILPAFSHFTGTALIEPKPGDAVFAIVEQQLVSIPS